MSNRDNSMREMLWLALRKSNKGDTPSSSTHLGVLLQYAIDNFINDNNCNDNDNDGNTLTSSSPLKSFRNTSSSDQHYRSPTPITYTPRLSGTRNHSFFSPNLSPSSSSLLSPEFTSISYPGSRLGTPSSSLDLKIKQQKSALHSYRESI